MLWKNKSSIPPVSNSSSSPHTKPPYAASNSDSYRSSSSSTYVASRDGDRFRSYPSSTSRSSSRTIEDSADRVNKGNDEHTRGLPNAYARGDADYQRDRVALLEGYNPQQTRAGSGRFFDGAENNSSGNPGEETEEDVEGIKQQIRSVKQDSVNSTKNALRMAREAEETARNTLTKLGDQSEKLANTERHLDVAKGHSARAQDKAEELKQLNRSIFRPAFILNKDKKRAAEEARIQVRHDEEREEREKAMQDIRETQIRMEGAATYGRGNNERHTPTDTQRLEQRKRFQFGESASDDEMEKEIEDNLDDIGDVSNRLLSIANTMNQELDVQNGRIQRLQNKTDILDSGVTRNTDRLKRIK